MVVRQKPHANPLFAHKHSIEPETSPEVRYRSFSLVLQTFIRIFVYSISIFQKPYTPLVADVV